MLTIPGKMPSTVSAEITGERLAHQLARLLARGRFGPIVLLLRDGRRILICERGQVCVEFESGTIQVKAAGEMQEVLFEDLLALELRPRPPRGS